MGQCRTLDADVTIGCYYGDHSFTRQHHSYIRPFLFGTTFITLTLVCLVPR